MGSKFESKNDNVPIPLEHFLTVTKGASDTVLNEAVEADRKPYQSHAPMNPLRTALVTLGLAAEPPIQLTWLNIEFSSKCNLRCKWCSLDHAKPAVHLDEPLLARALDEVLDERIWSVGEIALHNAGEVLLHPNLAAMLGVIARKRQGRDRFPVVSLLTNASLLNEANSRLLLESRALDLVRFSVDGGTPAAFEELRRPAKWERVRSNVHRFVKLNHQSERRVRTGVLCLVSPGQPLTLDWMHHDFRALLLAVDHFDVQHPHNWDGSKDLGLNLGDWKARDAKYAGRVCKFLQHDLVILPDGRVTVCCADLNARGVIGNLKERSLREIHGSAERAGMIRAFLSKDKASLPLCKDCPGYYGLRYPRLQQLALRLRQLWGGKQRRRREGEF